MKIRLQNLRKMGRFKLADGREVNIHSGTKPRRSEKLYFYLYRGSRVFVPTVDYFKLEKVES